jgi:hypothetical protein
MSLEILQAARILLPRYSGLAIYATGRGVAAGLKAAFTTQATLLGHGKTLGTKILQNWKRAVNMNKMAAGGMPVDGPFGHNFDKFLKGLGFIDIIGDLLISSDLDKNVITTFIPGTGLIEIGLFAIANLARIEILGVEPLF